MSTTVPVLWYGKLLKSGRNPVIRVVRRCVENAGQTKDIEYYPDCIFMYLYLSHTMTTTCPKVQTLPFLAFDVPLDNYVVPWGLLPRPPDSCNLLWSAAVAAAVVVAILAARTRLR